ncbi:MAG: hypothetical protein H6742_13295 [Alphaproteobacteria bacterium]|nr:hypothetical protein [Alphaproteobacteria bacterium]
MSALLLMLPAMILAGSPAARAASCQDVAAVDERLQVAWVAPRGKRVGASASLEVVRVADLRAAARDTDTTEGFLQRLGLVGRKPSQQRVDRGWQVVIFDVERDWLCRPVEDGTPGDDIGGVAVCEDPDLKPRAGHRKGWTGCGYTLDTGASTRGLDVFRVDWETAATWGFCLMPLERFLAGA